MSLKYACLLLCPEEHIETANAACVDITGLESARHTFSVHNHVIDEDAARYAIAGTYVEEDEFQALQAVREALGGYVCVLKTYDPETEEWAAVQAHSEWLENNGFSRPEEDENGEY